MISKIKIIAGVAGVALGALALSSMVGAATTPLSVSCAGVVSNNVITWTASTTGGNAPYALAWSGNANIVGSTSTSVVATYGANATYVANIQATDGSSTVATSTCSGTVTSIVVTPTSTPPVVTPPHQLIMQPSLLINEGGHFLAHGMVVSSIGSSSFQATVWGVTYTINWSGNLSGSDFNADSEFLFRDGQTTTSSIQTQLAIGDEVGVSGKIDASAPFVVTANVVRDYSILKARDDSQENESSDNGDNGQRENDNQQGNSDHNNGDHGSSSSNSSNVDAQNQLNDLLKQLQGLENLFKSHGGNSND